MATLDLRADLRVSGRLSIWGRSQLLRSVRFQGKESPWFLASFILSSTDLDCGRHSQTKS